MNAVRAVAAASLALALVLPVAARADDAAAPPGTLVVALGLQSPVMQAGVVRGQDVILARGLEVELVRTLARRLHTHVGRFVYVPSQARLLASSGGGWQLAIAGIEPSRAAAGTDLSVPYLTTDVAVVTRAGLDRPHRLADLRSLLLCARRGSAGARALSRVRPAQRPALVTGIERLATLVRTGACDAALVPAVEAGRFTDGHGGSAGKVVGRIPFGHGFVMSVSRVGGIDVAAVDREVARLRRDGTLGRLARTWLGLDPAALRVLR